MRGKYKFIFAINYIYITIKPIFASVLSLELHCYQGDNLIGNHYARVARYHHIINHVPKDLTRSFYGYITEEDGSDTEVLSSDRSSPSAQKKGPREG